MRRRGIAAEILVGLVDDQRDAAGPRQIVEVAYEFTRIVRARGIVRRAQHDGAGAGIDRLRCILGARQGGVSGNSRNETRLDAEHGEPHLVIEVIGNRKNDIIAAPSDRHDGGAEGLIAAGWNGDFVGADVAAIIRRHVLCQRRAQRRQSCDIGVKTGGRIGGEAGDFRLHFGGRRIARHRLAEIDEGAVFRARPDPAHGLGDGRRLDLGDRGIDGILHDGAPMAADEKQNHAGRGAKVQA